MKKIIAGILMLSCCAGCSFVKINKKAVEEYAALHEPAVEQFSSIVCNVPADLKIFQGEGDSYVSLKAPERLLKKIEVICKDGVLTISSKEKNIRNWIDFDINVSTPDLESLEVNGVAEVDIFQFKTDSLSLTVNDVGEVAVKNIDCGNLTVQIKGVGEVEISGRADRADLEISGVGEIDIEHFDCPSITRSINGVGAIR